MSVEKSILIVDDEENIRTYLGQFLNNEGFQVSTTGLGQECAQLMMRKTFDLVLLDLKLPDTSGLYVLNEIKKIDSHTVVVMITAHGDVSSAVEAMKRGAYDYLTKPFDFEDIKIVVNKALEVVGLKNRINVLERQLDNWRIGEFVTRSQEMFKLLEFIELVADSSATVMIYGETGTGKELIASTIHEKGRGSDKPFVTIDCTALSENLLASELFGHEKGAFTSALEQKRGLFEIANGGTVFLDEIGELPLNLQAMILKVLESKTFRRVGGATYRTTDVQIIGATNRDLKQFVEEKRFRKDLYYRLNVVPVHIPPLRKRREDILPLIEHFIRHFNKKIGRNVMEVSNQALKKLIDYPWPGNIRELRNIIEHMVIVSKGRVIDLESLPLEIRGSMPAPVDAFSGEPGSQSTPLPDFREAKAKLISDFEENYLRHILAKNKGNVSECAREMKMHRSSFQRLMRKYKLAPTLG